MGAASPLGTWVAEACGGAAAPAGSLQAYPHAARRCSSAPSCPRVCSTCSRSPWPSCSSPCASTFTSSQDAKRGGSGGAGWPRALRSPAVAAHSTRAALAVGAQSILPGGRRGDAQTQGSTRCEGWRRGDPGGDSLGCRRHKETSDHNHRPFGLGLFRRRPFYKPGAGVGGAAPEAGRGECRGGTRRRRMKRVGGLPGCAKLWLLPAGP